MGGEIPDDRAGGEVFTANITVNFPSVPGLCKVEDVDLFLNIEHDETRDLDVFLDHTDLRSPMFEDICFDDEGVLVTLDDDDPDGNGPIGNAASCAGTGPVGGGDTYTTQSGTGLEDFEGADPRGQWSLVVDDDFQTTFGFGRVVEWKLILDIGKAP
jgi:subtilisin-like proprotein convertase family protein